MIIPTWLRSWRERMSNAETHLARIRAGEITLQHVPRKEKTHALCVAAVHMNGRDIINVPSHLRSKAVCYAAVYQNPMAIKAVPLAILQDEPGILELALGRNGTLLKWAAETEGVTALLTERMCEKAVNSHGRSLQHVPPQLRTREMVRNAIIRDGALLMLLEGKESLVGDLIEQIHIKHLPDQFKTEKRCLAQVKEQGRLLRYVPLRVMTEEIIEAALQSNPWAIEYVPATFADSAPVKAAIRRGGFPEKLLKNLALQVAG
ncbi:MAG: hypothetical protein MI751_07655 [Pseudomonadales bacterium]|nr:hypothetical protein [Pseudomonadales bacterium]